MLKSPLEAICKQAFFQDHAGTGNSNPRKSHNYVKELQNVAAYKWLI